MTEKLVTVDEQCKDPFVTIFHFSPISALLAAPVAMFFELGDFMSSPFMTHSGLFWEAFMFISVGGAIAFVMLFVEVKIVNLTSSLTIGVLGQLKELTQITLAVVVFGDKLSFINTCGVVASFLFVGVYKWIRRSEMKEVLLAESMVASQKEKQQVVALPADMFDC
jgi:solute carrier family 35 protein C2